jgi:hypothetical protein
MSFERVAELSAAGDLDEAHEAMKAKVDKAMLTPAGSEGS